MSGNGREPRPVDASPYDGGMASAGRPARAIAISAATAVTSLAVLSTTAALSATDPGMGDPPSAASWWVTAVVLVLQAAALLLPVARGAMLLVVAFLPMLPALAMPGSLFSLTALPILVAAFLTGLRVPFRRLWRIVAASAFLVFAGQLANSLLTGRTDYPVAVLEAVIQAVLTIGLPLLPATAIAGQRAARQAQQSAVEALVRQRDAQIGEAVALERAAMARELHDIAAHHLSGIAVMASAVERQVRTDPDAAREGAVAVRRQSRAVLDDLRRLVGLLRDADGADDTVKTLETIPSLVSAAVATGMRVDLLVERPADASLGSGIGPLGQLAAYRMVQESLTNAARHAPGAACVVAVDDRDPARMLVRVRNGPAVQDPGDHTAGSGFGILGMRERAALIGGTFTAGRAEGGGWETTMSIPREPAAAEARTAS